MMDVDATVYCPMYDINDKKYIKLTLSDNDASIVRTIHDKYTVEHDPLDGRVLQVKIPWRYRRVMCDMVGDKIPQELSTGDLVFAKIQFEGRWSRGSYKGLTWKLLSI